MNCRRSLLFLAISALLFPVCMAKQETTSSAPMNETAKPEAAAPAAPVMMDELATTGEAEPAPEPVMSSAKMPPMGKMDAKPADMELADDMDMPAEGEIAKPMKKKAVKRQRPRPREPKPPPEKKLVFVDQPTVKYLSADDSNSTASPVIARKLVGKGKYVPPGIVRTYEFLNHASFDYPDPPQGKLVHIVPEMRAVEDKPGSYSLQVAVRALKRKRQDMQPMNVTVLLDTSGSMAGEPIELAKSFLRTFVSKLRPGERISLVQVNREAELLLENHAVGPKTPGTLDELLKGKIQVTDITDLECGLALAYKIAGRNYDYKYSNRVLLLSDGAANAGKTSIDLIAKHAEDSDRQGIYLTGIGFGEGFNDALMDAVTDRGRGAYAFIDSAEEARRLLSDDNFVATFDVAVKDVRLKMVMPPRFSMEEFHGEQISSVKSEVIPQYLSPNDQMIYHLVVATDLKPEKAKKAVFEFEVEFRPIGKDLQKASSKRPVAKMLTGNARILKGDALVRYAETLKKIGFPFEENKEKNLEELGGALAFVDKVNQGLKDPELDGAMRVLQRYQKVCQYGEDFADARDMAITTPDAVLGLKKNLVLNVKTSGPAVPRAIQGLKRLGSSNRLRPMEGQRFLALGSGPIGNRTPSSGGQFSGSPDRDPMPAFLGSKPAKSDGRPVYDKHQIVIELLAPKDAKSFSFDFNFFSAEYPQYVNKNYNDTFYAILEAGSTNQGKPTNISFDADGQSIEVDNNYFQRPFHPIPNWGTGFDHHGSTGWLRTSWPIKGGERFKLTFSIHDEGDGIFDSVVLLDNFQWHDYAAVGNTDPLN